ncbi:MAG: mechanosensitive ion channel [Flavobacteriales bacterium]|nr:mechanosensitive ion channel [Flavobacteriales bacterium]
MKKWFENILEFNLVDINNYKISVLDLLLILLIFAVARFLVSAVNTIIKNKLSKKGIIDVGRAKSVSQIFRYIIYTISVIIAVESLGIDLSVIFGVFAALGLGIGFALQDVFKDLISGIVILFEGNVSVGDILEMDGLVGSVTQINMRTSQIKTLDGVYMVIPNSKIVNEKVINWSANNKISRFNVSVGVAYGTDVEKVRTILLACAAANPKVSKTPESQVFFNDFGDSSLVFQLLFWIEDTWQTELVKSELRFAINAKFKEEGIQIPFPQRDVHIIQ